MYMIEITENAKDKMAEHAEKVLRHAGKLMQCIEELGASQMGERGGRYGERWDEDDDEDYMGERYGNRGGNSGGYGERRGVRGTGRYSRYR